MSNSKELDLLIATAFKGEGADAAVAKLKAIATAADQAQTELVRAFNAGELGAAEFNAGIAKSQAGVNEYVQAARRAAQTTEAHAAGHGTLASALGASRQQAAGMVGTLGQMAGASSNVSTAIQSIASGLGPVGITLALFTLQMEEYNKKVTEAGKILADYARARAATPIGPIVSLEDTQKIAAANVQLEKLTKQMAALKDLQATGGFGGEETERLKQQIAALQAQIDKTAQSTLGATTADQGLRESFRESAAEANRVATAIAVIEAAQRRLALASGAANQLVTFTEQADRASDAAMGLESSLSIADYMLNQVAGSGRVVTDAFGNLTVETIDADGAMHNFAGSVNEVNQNMQQAGSSGSAAMKAFLGDEAYKANIQAGNEALASRTRAISDASQAASRAASQAAQEAATLEKFNKDGAAAVAVYGAKAQEAFNLIANSALTAAQKVELLNMWERTLPSEIQQKITIFLAAGGDPALIALLLGGGIGAIAGGNQQGNQALFTLWGESLATQTAFLAANNNDRDAAARVWTAQHLAAVQQSVNTGFDMTGRKLTQLERDLTQAIIDAANDPTNSSGDPYAANSDDPRYRPPRYTEFDDNGRRQNPFTGAKTAAGGIVTSPQVRTVGEAGPEAIIPLSQMPNMMPNTDRGLTDAITKLTDHLAKIPPTVVIHATIDDKMDVEELAARVTMHQRHKGS